MHKQTHKRAFYTLAGCIAALALCVAASLFLLTPAPKAQDVTIPGTRGDIYATVQLPGKLARGEELPLVVLCHGFTGSRSEVQECLDLGLFIGITGWVCDERRGLELRELLPAIPAERLLLETDAPYLLPRDLKPKPASRRNEPAYLPHILASVAAWRGEEAQWLEAQTDANVRALFGVDINGV